MNFCRHYIARLAECAVRSFTQAFDIHIHNSDVGYNNVSRQSTSACTIGPCIVLFSFFPHSLPPSLFGTSHMYYNLVPFARYVRDSNVFISVEVSGGYPDREGEPHVPWMLAQSSRGRIKILYIVGMSLQAWRSSYTKIFQPQVYILRLKMKFSFGRVERRRIVTADQQNTLLTNGQPENEADLIEKLRTHWMISFFST